MKLDKYKMEILSIVNSYTNISAQLNNIEKKAELLKVEHDKLIAEAADLKTSEIALMDAITKELGEQPSATEILEFIKNNKSDVPYSEIN